MNNENVLRNYYNLGINSEDNLYDYVSNNTEVVIDERRFKLTKSNELIEFMAGFLEALNLKVVRLYFSNNNEDNPLNYWFLAFNNGFKWFFYEPCLEGIKGKYTFDEFDELVKFVTSKVIGLTEENVDSNTYEKYSLKEIEPLQNFMLRQDVKQSKNGKDIPFYDKLEINDEVIESNEVENYVEDSENIKRQGKFFFLGFIPTLLIGLGLLWYLANFFYGN